MGACDFYDENDYDWNSYANEPSNDDKKEERFTNSFPYERDNETGMSRGIFDDPGVWKDSMGREYEQKTDCWGNPYYDPIDKDDD